jgi:hypothetical protein
MEGTREMEKKNSREGEETPGKENECQEPTSLNRKWCSGRIVRWDRNW